MLMTFVPVVSGRLRYPMPRSTMLSILAVFLPHMPNHAVPTFIHAQDSNLPLCSLCACITKLTVVHDSYFGVVRNDHVPQSHADLTTLPEGNRIRRIRDTGQILNSRGTNSSHVDQGEICTSVGNGRGRRALTFGSSKEHSSTARVQVHGRASWWHRTQTARAFGSPPVALTHSVRRCCG